MANTALQVTKHVFREDLTAATRRPPIVASTQVPLPVLKQSTAVRPVAVMIPLAACASFFIAERIGFAGDHEAAVSVFMAGFINVMLIGLLPDAVGTPAT
jgi:hypothetical protein